MNKSMRLIKIEVPGHVNGTTVRSAGYRIPVCHGLAICRTNYRATGWSLVHVESGMSIANFASKSEALGMLAESWSVTNWTLDEHSVRRNMDWTAMNLANYRVKHPAKQLMLWSAV